jgi:hypothetical protein
MTYIYLNSCRIQNPCLLYDNLILGEECDPIPPPPPSPFSHFPDDAGMRLLWWWRLDGWPNTAARLAGWRRVTRQVWFCVWWTGHIACLFRTVPVALTGAARMRADGISSWCYNINVHNHPSWATSRKEGMAWYSSGHPCPVSLVLNTKIKGKNVRTAHTVLPGN